MWVVVALWLEHRTLNQENLISNPLDAILKLGQFCLLHIASVHRVEYEYLAVDSGGCVNKYSLCSNCSMAECFTEKLCWRRNEQVCQGVKCKSLPLNVSLHNTKYVAFILSRLNLNY